MRILILVALLVLVGCASSPKKMNKLAVGMTKTEVVSVMGKPKSTSASQGNEYLIYVMDASRVDHLMPESYYVKLVGGKVEGYGRVRDLPGRQLPQ